MIEIVAKTLPLVEEVVDIENFSVYIARIGKVKDNPEKLLKYLLKHKHISPFEHTYFTFKIQTSLAIGRELLRHRSFTFQERSLRYEESIGFEPVELRKQSETNRQSSTEVFDPNIKYMYDTEKVSSALNDCLYIINCLYQELIEAGVARECARMILPSCTSTTILMTGNIRSWLTFLDVRNHKDAQLEMQKLAQEIENKLMEEIPITIKMWRNGM